MTSLQKFAAFILNHQLDKISSFYISRARETKLSLLSLFEHLTEAQLHEIVKQNFTQLLDSMVAGKAYEHALQSIALWVEDKFPGIKSDDPGLHDLVQVISIRKYSFIKVLPAFTQDLEVYTEVILEMNAYYDFYREKAYEAYIHIQHQKLQKEKAFIELVVDTTTEGILAVDTELRVTLWNKALAERTGVKKEDILGKPLFDFFPKNKTVLEVEAIQKAQQGEHVYLENIPIKSRQGFYDMNVVPLKVPAGHITGSLTVSRDVTQRKRMLDELQTMNEELHMQSKELQTLNKELEANVQELRQAQKNLEESNQFIESVVNTSPDYITVYNLKERKNIYANKGVAEFLGYDEQEARAGDFAFLTTLIHPEDLPLIKTFIEEYLHYTENAPRQLEYRVKDAQERYRWIRANYNVFRRDEEGNPLEVVGVSRDVTLSKMQKKQLQDANNELEAALEELKSAEEQLLQANEELEIRVQERTEELAASEEELRQLLDKSIELNEKLAESEEELLKRNTELTRINTDLDNFIYTASHDLKSPIVNLEGIVFALNGTIQEKLDATERKLFELIASSIDKLKETIGYLGDVTRVSKSLEERKEMISIQQVVELVKEDIAHMVEEVQPTFEEQYEVKQIEFSPANFRSIIYNLVSNAVKYRSLDRPLKVSISTYLQDKYVVLAVQDNGLGLSSKQQHKLFKMFRRLHTHVEGTGIGLYIVKRIIENSGGKIEVKSNLEKGSTFYAYFPTNQ